MTIILHTKSQLGWLHLCQYYRHNEWSRSVSGRDAIAITMEGKKENLLVYSNWWYSERKNSNNNI